MALTVADEYRPLADLSPNSRNYNIHTSPGAVERMANKVRHVGFTAPFIIQADGTILGGHLRRLALLALRAEAYPEPKGVEAGWRVPCRVVECNEAQALAILAGDNADPAEVEFDVAGLAGILAELQEQGELEASGYDPARLEALIAELAGEQEESAGSGGAGSPDPEAARQTLAARFGVPPFSVLDARQGYWQERKRAWIALGIQSELGRGENTLGRQPECEAYRGAEGDYTKCGAVEPIGEGLTAAQKRRRQAQKVSPGGSPRDAASLGTNGRTQRGDGRGHPIPGGGTGKNSGYLFRTAEGYRPLREIQQDEAHRAEDGWKATGLTFASGSPRRDEVSLKLQETSSGTSIFDPVLCELAYRWFSPEGGAVLDPFAGGSVRGIVAAKLGRRYTGIDLRGEQIQANELQAEVICGENRPRWVVGDSTGLRELAAGGEYDFVFSCPPYADLEVYSDDPRDLSTLPYEEFLKGYREIIRQAVALLREDRFACFVVGDVRDPRGFYRCFVADTVRAFEDAGAKLYNDAVLVTAVGSLPIRVGKQFGSYRKLGKTHQNVLVFYKGNPRRIAEIFDGDCQFGELAEPSE